MCVMMNDGSRKGLSVIIPTRDRAPALAVTLAALAAQDVVPGVCEVVVVDNGPHESTAAVVEAASVAARGVEVVGLAEPRPGPAAARNAGVRAARGAYVLFLGDDTAPADRGFLAGHLARLEGLGGAGGVLGRVEWDPGSRPTAFMEWLGRSGVQFAFDGLEAGRVDASDVFYTSNVSLPVSWLLRTGGFDERFTGAAVEDIELGGRLATAGMVLEHAPELVVLHDHHTTYRASLERMERVGRAARRYRELHPDRPHPGIGSPKALKRFLYRLAWSLLAEERRPADHLPRRLRELRWTLAHRHAYVRGLRARP